MENLQAPLPYLQYHEIQKIFPGVKALDRISFSVRAGSVHALVGENGAGKSTMLKILSGAYTPSSGTLRIGGQDVVFPSTAAALAAGIAVIYQELSTVPHMSVAENLYLGHLPKRNGIIDYRKLYQDARALLAPLSDDIDPKAPMKSLSIGQQQMVEIAKALGHGAKILAFDEPTSSLSARDTERLFAVIRKLKAEGCVILYVSHRMEEIFEICDAVSVFKDGCHVATYDSMDELTTDTLIALMVGREIRDVFSYSGRTHGENVLEVRGVEGPGLSEPLSINVRAGEIFGLFGLVGAGRSELLKLIFGATRKTAGEILVKGKVVSIANPRQAIDQGVVLCPENRKVEGIIPRSSVAENINISARRHFQRAFGILDLAWERRNARELARSLDVRTPSLQQLIRNLSGGNQQKVILARWLSDTMSVLLLDEPTRGIDVGARSEIYALIRKLADQGVAVLMVSSDLPEVLGVSDTIGVMRGGAISGVMDRAEASEEKILGLALPH